jgi:hypothetical protein
MYYRNVFSAIAAIVLSADSNLLAVTSLTVSSDADTSSPGTLRYAIQTAINDPINEYSVAFQNSVDSITLSSDLPYLPPNILSINGSIALGKVTIDGANSYRVFTTLPFSDGTASTNTLTLSNLIIQNAKTVGGAGGFPGGGAGAGCGSALLITPNTKVKIENILFSNNLSIGGDGGGGTSSYLAGGGGGGIFGNGGNGGSSVNGGGGGGGGLFGNGGIGGDGDNSNPGSPIRSSGGGGGGMIGNGGNAATGSQSAGGGGGGGSGNGNNGSLNSNGGAGGAPNGGAGATTFTVAQDGGNGGGGGGALAVNNQYNNGGAGGVAGGGGGGSVPTSSFYAGGGGSGGLFGGGGGSSSNGTFEDGFQKGGNGGDGGGGGGGGNARNNFPNIPGGAGGWGGGAGAPGNAPSDSYTIFGALGGFGGGGAGGAKAVLAGASTAGISGLQYGGHGGAYASGTETNGGGGGGAGFGGAVCVMPLSSSISGIANAELIIGNNVDFSSNQAQGGSGGIAFGGYNGSEGLSCGNDIIVPFGYGQVKYELDETAVLDIQNSNDNLYPENPFKFLQDKHDKILSTPLVINYPISGDGPVPSDLSLVLPLEFKCKGTIELTKTNTYYSPTKLSANSSNISDAFILKLSGNGSIANSIGIEVLENTTLDLSSATSPVVLNGLGSSDDSSTGAVLIGINGLELIPNNFFYYDRKFKGAISGSGSLTISGGSSFSNIFFPSFVQIFETDDLINYAGITTIKNGATLQINNNNSFPVNGDVNIDETSLLKFDFSTLDDVYLNELSGNGSVTINNTDLYLNGFSNFNGSFNKDSIFGKLTVNENGTLKGNVTINCDIENKGTLIPGNSIGEIIINGNFTQLPTGILEIEVDQNNQVDLLTINGDANLGGSILFTSSNNSNIYPKSSTYTFLTATGMINNQFLNPGNNLSLIYTEHSVSIVASYPNPTTYNALNVFNYISNSNFINFSDFKNITDVLATLDVSELNAALEQLTPIQFGALDFVNLNNSTIITQVFKNRTSLKCCKKNATSSCSTCDNEEGNFWVSPLGYLMYQDAIDKQPGFKTHAQGVCIGGDFKVSDCFVFGLGTGWLGSYTKWDKNLGNATINSGYLGGYLNFNEKSFYVESSVIGNINGVDATRNISLIAANSFVSPVFRKAKHTNWQFGFDAHFGMGFDITKVLKSNTKYNCIPFGNLDYIYNAEREFSETGANSINLEVGRKTAQSLRSEIGFLLTKIFEYGVGNCFTPSIWLSAINECFINPEPFYSEFQNQDFGFYTKTFENSIYLIAPGFDLNFQFKNGNNFNLRYNLEINRSIQNHKFDFRIDFNF